MSSPIQVGRGVPELRRLHHEQTFDLRSLNLAGFRRWLESHLGHWQKDPVFVQRVRIRDLRRIHPQLASLEAAHRRAAVLDQVSPHFGGLSRLEKSLIDTGKAVSGLTEALERTTPQKEPILRQKLNTFRAKQRTLQEEQATLVQSSPERHALLRIRTELHQLRSAIGLDQEEARLEMLLRQKGRRSGRAGESFEQVALALTQSHILPDLLQHTNSGEDVQRLHVLSGVTLGAARTELDQVIIRRPQGSEHPVEVLAVVEAKRNINDVARGFRQRQENLAWLTGDAANYDPALYRTRYFRSGCFDREAVHEEQDETFIFARSSFRNFQRDSTTGFVLGRLYFITREGMLWGISAAALGRIGFRIATDEHWNPDGDSYLSELLSWCQSLAESIETPDVLRMYSSSPSRGREILVAGR